MKYLVTGGAGFIGSNLVKFLLAKDEQAIIIVLDDFSTGKIENLFVCENNKNRLHIEQGSVLDRILLSEIMCECDIVYHFASSVGVKYILSTPIESLDSNILGSRTVFDVATELNKRVIFSSSSEVYGKNSNVPYREDDDKILGASTISRWSYSTAKSLSEYYAIAYMKKGLQIDIFRFFNIVGPGQSDQYGMVLPVFLQKATAGEDIPIYGDGEQKRCFTSVRDIVEICYMFSKMPKSTNEIYNVGNNNVISIEELANLIIMETNSSSKKIYIPYKEAYGAEYEDCKIRVPCIEKLRNVIGDYQFIDIHSIIRDILTHG